MFDEICDPFRTNDAAAPVIRTASRRKAAFLALLSTRWTFAPGVSASAQPMIRPGKPPPEPRSTHMRHFRVFGSNAKSCSESAMWRVHRIGSVDGAIRLIRCCHRLSKATKRSRRASVSRETGVSDKAGAIRGKIVWFDRRTARNRSARGTPARPVDRHHTTPRRGLRC